MSGTCDVDLSGDFDDFDDTIEDFCEILSHSAEDDSYVECEECARTLLKEEPRYVRTYTWQEKEHLEHVCLACHEVTNEFGYNTMGGGLWDAMADSWDEGANILACIQRVHTVAAKKRLHAEWLRWNERYRTSEVNAAKHDANKMREKLGLPPSTP